MVRPGLIARECIKRGAAFEDPDFPANRASIFDEISEGSDKNLVLESKVVWTRLKEICKSPMRIFPVKQHPSEVCPGHLECTWLQTAMAMVVTQPRLLQQMMLNTEHTEQGLYVVRLFDLRAGCWCPVAIDDRIPCDKETGNPLFTHSPDTNRQAKGKNGRVLNVASWVMIVEKACAKLIGSYESLLR